MLPLTTAVLPPALLLPLLLLVLVLPGALGDRLRFLLLGAPFSFFLLLLLGGSALKPSRPRF